MAAIVPGILVYEHEAEGEVYVAVDEGVLVKTSPEIGQFRCTTPYPDTHSWTLMLLVAGLIIGCWNAWYWVAKEDRAMRDEQEDDDA